MRLVLDDATGSTYAGMSSLAHLLCTISYPNLSSRSNMLRGSRGHIDRSVNIS